MCVTSQKIWRKSENKRFLNEYIPATHFYVITGHLNTVEQLVEAADLGPAHDYLFCWIYRQQKQRGFTASLHYWLKAAFQIPADCMQAWQMWQWACEHARERETRSRHSSRYKSSFSYLLIHLVSKVTSIMWQWRRHVHITGSQDTVQTWLCGL